jgi:hypothetical protein
MMRPSLDRAVVPPAVADTGFPDTAASTAAEDETRRLGLVYLSFLALLVGIVDGFGAVGFPRSDRAYS